MLGAPFGCPCFSQLLPCHPEVILGLNSPLQGEAPAGAAENTGWAQRGRGQKARARSAAPFTASLPGKPQQRPAGTRGELRKLKLSEKNKPVGPRPGPREPPLASENGGMTFHAALASSRPVDFWGYRPCLPGNLWSSREAPGTQAAEPGRTWEAVPRCRADLGLQLGLQLETASL